MYLYIIKQEDSDYYKIGRASNVETRLCSIQNGNPELLEYVLLFGASYNDCINSECELHHLFKSQKVRNEWFKLDGWWRYRVRSFLKHKNGKLILDIL